MRTHKIKAVFFDFDGVITTQKSGSYVTNEYISKKIGIPYNEFDKIIRPLNNQLLLGELSHKDIFPYLSKEFKISIDEALLNDAFLSTKMNYKIIEIADKLKYSYFIGIITDNKNDRIEFLRKYHNLDSIFSSYIVSSQIGALKKEEKPFIEAFIKNGFEYSECIFIDNNKENLIVPNKLGANTVFYDDEKNDYIELIEVLNVKYGLLV